MVEDRLGVGDDVGYGPVGSTVRVAIAGATRAHIAQAAVDDRADHRAEREAGTRRPVMEDERDAAGRAFDPEIDRAAVGEIDRRRGHQR
jgi:hypothetical protein